MAYEFEIAIIVTIIVLIMVVAIVLSAVRIINPWEQGLEIRLGSFIGKLNPGLRFVVPLVTTVVKIDLRTQVFDVPRQEVITKDNSPTNVDAIIYIKVIDPQKAFFQINNYRVATIALAQTTLRSTIGDMELDEILYNRHSINVRLRDILDEATDPWGVKVEAVEIREVDPVGPVKAAMEEQTSAERERRAAILRADGEKRSAILKAEGAKRSRILQAEGVRQSKILEAEGQRQAKILEMQGEAQSLRLLSVGAAVMDQKALTVKSLDTLALMSNGQATKIIFPFEISRLIEGASQFIGAGSKVPERQVTSAQDLERIIGRAEDVLGPIPSAQELKDEIQTLEKEMQKETMQAEQMVAMGSKSAPGGALGAAPLAGRVEELMRMEPTAPPTIRKLAPQGKQ
ncbi:MAG: SPFH/Band 7/PHB domain protein [Euryarchaeota archaeon]|nr:SPFH/Band 7/PHB domain protein [Euryarchaeota archaeon]